MTSTSPSTLEPYPPAVRQLALTALLVALALTALDQTIVSVAAPVIGRELRLTPSLYSLVLTGYLLGNVIVTPISGKFSDMFGRKPILLFGLVCFTFGSMLCGIAGDGWFLVGARVIKGLGAGAIQVASFSAISDLFPPNVRGRYLGLFGAVYGISSIVGPLLGGFLTDGFGWRSIFLINIPIGTMVLCLVAWKMPALGNISKQGKIDWLGGLTLILALTSLILALSLGRNSTTTTGFGFAWLSWEIAALFAISSLGLIGFFLAERSAKNPILNPKLFANQSFAAACISALFMGAVFLPVILFLPIYLVSGLGLSATIGGLILMPLSLAFALANIFGGMISSRLRQVRIVLVIGGLIAIVAYLLLAWLVAQQMSLILIVICSFVLGLGLGPSTSLYALSAQNALGAGMTGVASGSSSLFRNVGTTIGTALLGTLLALGLQNGQSYPSAIASVFLCCAAISLIGTLLTLRMAR